MESLLPIFYLPPVSWWKVFLDNDNKITFEQFENFPKQTYRNRANIYGANGKLSLIIPIKHTGKRALHEIEISYAERWKDLHWKSIKTAYQSSPYFEFYEDSLAEIFSFETDSLMDFNLNGIGIIQKILKTEKAYSLNSAYSKDFPGEDFRLRFSAKNPENPIAPHYYQVFGDRFGFLPDLSVVDLICNEGPGALAYIENFNIR